MPIHKLSQGCLPSLFLMFPSCADYQSGTQRVANILLNVSFMWQLSKWHIPDCQKSFPQVWYNMWKSIKVFHSTSEFSTTLWITRFLWLMGLCGFRVIWLPSDTLCAKVATLSSLYLDLNRLRYREQIYVFLYIY